jgi:inositol phosphorylceramide mannosyltransferase catalytic subunit
MSRQRHDERDEQHAPLAAVSPLETPPEYRKRIAKPQPECFSQRTLLLLVSCGCLVIWSAVSFLTVLNNPEQPTHHGALALAETVTEATAEASRASVTTLSEATADINSADPVADTTTRSEPTQQPTPAAKVRIPRLIHQSWKSTERIPERFAPWMRSWVEMHPGWQYVYWSDDDNLALFEHLYPKYLDVARHVGKIGLADMARYALLHRLGGLYVDADFECTQPFDGLHRTHDVFLSSEPRAHAILLEGSPTPALCNALMASVPGHPFWIQVLDSIKAAYDTGVSPNDPVTLTGPRIVKKTYEALDENNSDVVLLAPEYFYPEVAYWNMGNLRKGCTPDQKDLLVKEACAWLDKYPHGEFTNHTYATHHWQCTWCNGDGGELFLPLSKVMRYQNDAPMIIFKPKFQSDGLRLEYYPI